MISCLVLIEKWIVLYFVWWQFVAGLLLDFCWAEGLGTYWTRWGRTQMCLPANLAEAVTFLQATTEKGRGTAILPRYQAHITPTPHSKQKIWQKWIAIPLCNSATSVAWKAPVFQCPCVDYELIYWPESSVLCRYQRNIEPG